MSTKKKKAPEEQLPPLGVVVRIYTRCPACGNDALMINDGRLLCTWMKCPDPTLIDRVWDEASVRRSETAATIGGFS